MYMEYLVFVFMRDYANTPSSFNMSTQCAPSADTFNLLTLLLITFYWFTND